MLILQIITLANSNGLYGGPFDAACNQARLLEDAGHDVSLVTGRLRHDSLMGIASGVKLTAIPVRRHLPTPDFTSLFSWSILRCMWRMIGKSDVVHIGLGRELIPVAALVISAIRRVPVVIQPHGMLTSRVSLAHRVVDLVLRPLVSHVATSVIALTKIESQELAAWDARLTDRISTIGNPLPYTAEERHQLLLLRRLPEALFLARLHPRKRVRDFVDAATTAASRGWTDKYLVIGPDQGDLRSVEQAAGNLPNLTYAGSISPNKVPNQVGRSSVFVLPSKSEPWGNVLVMAINLGIPVVVTESAALADEIRSNKLGIVVPDGDTAAIARAVHDLINLKKAVPSAFAESHYSNTAVACRLDTIFRDAIG